MTAGYLEYVLAGLFPLLLAAAIRVRCAVARPIPVRVVDRPKIGAAHQTRR